MSEQGTDTRAGEDAYPQKLVESVATLSRLVLSEEDMPSTLRRITNLAVTAIDGVEQCSISLARNGDVSTVAATANVITRLDDIQYETKEGPCLSSIEKHETFRIPDMEHDKTWPTFSKRAAEETGLKSMLSFVLEVHHDALGALNLVSSRLDAFTEDDVAAGSIFAAQASIALKNAIDYAGDKEQIEQLRQAMMTRQIIGQAVGLVMASKQADEQEAFQTLVQISQHTNVKLRDLARRVVDKASDL